MKLARVFVAEYPGKEIGDIHDVIDPLNHPGSLLSGIIQEVEVDDNFDKDVMVAVINGGEISFEEDEDKLAAQVVKEKEALITVKYNEMTEDVLGQMTDLFGTTKTDSAAANHETWKLMAAKPELFSGEGLVSTKNVAGYAVGVALDSNLKVQTWAEAMLDFVEAYGVSRAKRIQQFVVEKAAILAE